MRLNSKTVAFFGVSAALVFVVLLVESYVFTLFLPTAPPAVLTLPLAFSLSMFGKKKTALFGGTALGVCSFIVAIMLANPIFINPLISVLPRMICGILSAVVYSLILKAFSGKKFVSSLAASLGGSVGVLFNTILVIFMMYVFDAGALGAIFTTIMSVNFLCEMISAIILSPIIVGVINKNVKIFND